LERRPSSHRGGDPHRAVGGHFHNPSRRSNRSRRATPVGVTHIGIKGVRATGHAGRPWVPGPNNRESEREGFPLGIPLGNHLRATGTRRISWLALTPCPTHVRRGSLRRRRGGSSFSWPGSWTGARRCHEQSRVRRRSVSRGPSSRATGALNGTVTRHLFRERLTGQSCPLRALAPEAIA
jgi:hypothetical protein